jgi:hypothetical protein
VDLKPEARQVLLALTRFELTPEGLHCAIEIPLSEYNLGS